VFSIITLYKGWFTDELQIIILYLAVYSHFQK